MSVWGSGCPDMPCWEAAREARTFRSSEKVPSPPVCKIKAPFECLHKAQHIIPTQGVERQSHKAQNSSAARLQEELASTGTRAKGFWVLVTWSGLPDKVCLGATACSPGTSSSMAAAHSHRCRDSI